MQDESARVGPNKPVVTSVASRSIITVTRARARVGGTENGVTLDTPVTRTPVPYATFQKLKKQLREERTRRAQAEAERDAVKTTLACVLDGLKGSGG